MSFDLSAITDDKLALILLRVPVNNLIKNCPQVSRQWNRILSANHFWRQRMEQDGYQLEWTKLVGLSIRSLKCLALRHSFGRNFIKDKYNIKMDERWKAYQVIRDAENNQVDGGGKGSHIEIPPIFSDGRPKYESGAEFCGGPIMACRVTGSNHFAKRIVIKLADEGLTDNIMDNFQPTICVSEMVANRRDCAASYLMNCALLVEEDEDFHAPDDGDNDQDQQEYREVHTDERGRWVSATILLKFKLGQVEEGWTHVEHQFKNYPPGMRYLSMMCIAHEHRQTPIGHGCKLANCTVKALCEKNAE